MSGRHEEREGVRDWLERSSSPFSRETLESICEVNELFLSWLVHSEHLRAAEKELGELLRNISPESLRQTASCCPFLLVDAHFADTRAWRDLLKEAEGQAFFPFSNEIAEDRWRLTVARATFFVSWYIVRRAPDGASLLLGTTEEVTRIIRSLELTRLQQLAEAKMHWIGPRWPDRLDVWRHLLFVATQTNGVAQPSLRPRALQLFLGKLI